MMIIVIIIIMMMMMMMMMMMIIKKDNEGHLQVGNKFDDKPVVASKCMRMLPIYF